VKPLLAIIVLVEAVAETPLTQPYEQIESFCLHAAKNRSNLLSKFEADYIVLPAKPVSQAVPPDAGIPNEAPPATLKVPSLHHQSSVAAARTITVPAPAAAESFVHLAGQVKTLCIDYSAAAKATPYRVSKVAFVAQHDPRSPVLLVPSTFWSTVADPPYGSKV
jgi:hypothetical protein